MVENKEVKKEEAVEKLEPVVAKEKTVSEVIEMAATYMQPEVNALLMKFAEIKFPDARVERDARFAVFHMIALPLAFEISARDAYATNGLLDSVKEGFPDFYKKVMRNLFALEQASKQTPASVPAPAKVEKK